MSFLEGNFSTNCVTFNMADFTPSDGRQLITCKEFLPKCYEPFQYTSLLNSLLLSLGVHQLALLHFKPHTVCHQRQLLCYILQSSYHTSCIFLESVSLCIILKEVKDPPPTALESPILLLQVV
jgi:hypothetical protein